MRKAFLLAICLLFVPSLAQAHGGHSHDATQAAQEPAKAEVVVLRAALEPACPDGPGHVCPCGNLTACSSGDTAGVVSPAYWVWLEPQAFRPASRSRDAAFSSSVFLNARPRAPPSLS